MDLTAQGGLWLDRRRERPRGALLVRAEEVVARDEAVEQECYGLEYENATIGGRRMFRRICGTTPRGERVSLRELQGPKGSSPGQWASGKVGLVSGTLKPGGKGGRFY